MITNFGEFLGVKKIDLNPDLGNIAYSGKLSKLGEKNCLIRQKKLFQK